MNGRRENGGWAAKWCAGYLIGLTFLLPLKFGSLAVLPEATSFYPGDLFSWLIINWPAHSFGIFSGVALFAALVVFAPGMRPLRTSGGATALLWSFGLVLVSLIGWINAATIDYAVGETIHLAGIGAYVLAVRLWLRNRPEERRWFCAALAAGACWLIYSGLSQYFVGFAETREFVEKQIAEGIPISHVMVAKINDDRVFATFVSCNVLAGYLLLLLPVTLYAVWRFAGHFEPVRLSRILLCGLVFSGLVAVLLLTRSRAAFLAALLTAGAFAMTLPKRRIYRCIPVIVLALAIVGGAIYIHRAGRGFGSMAERVDYLRSSVKMIAEKPLAGHGWGGFFYRHMELKTTGTDESAHDPHNLVMAFASQTGVIGGAVALAAVLAGHAERGVLVHETVVADDRGAAYDDADPVVNGEAPADLRRGVDVCPVLDARALGEPQGEVAVPVLVEPVLSAIRAHDAKSHREARDVGDRAGGGIALEGRLGILADEGAELGPGVLLGRHHASTER